MDTIKISHAAIELAEQRHWYRLVADLTLDASYKGFRLEILWPAHIPITYHHNFEEGDEQNIGGTRYIQLILYGDRSALTSQKGRIIGSDSQAVLAYEFDKELATLAKATSLNLYYKLYLLDNPPVEGEIPFETLNDFFVNQSKR